MIAALQSSRSSDAPPAPVDVAPGQEEEVGPGDAMVQKLEDLEAKLDQILELLGEDESVAENDATEAPPNDDGY